MVEPPVPVDELAEEVEGLDVQEAADLSLIPGVPALAPGAHLSGLLIPAQKRIWVNAVESAQSEGRRRFTIAHELGHWRLHVHAATQARSVIHCRSEEVGGETAQLMIDRAKEVEANHFAANLLMPRVLIQREAKATKLNIPLLARRFQVSLPAMKIRLEALDLLPHYMR